MESKKLLEFLQKTKYNHYKITNLIFFRSRTDLFTNQKNNLSTFKFRFKGIQITFNFSQFYK